MPSRGKRAAPERRVPDGVSRRRRWKLRLLGLALLLLLGFGLFLTVLYVFTPVPEPSAATAEGSAVVLDRSGREIGRLLAQDGSAGLPLSAVPMNVRWAVISAEDRDFYRHPGVSPAAILRAALSDLVHLRIREGGSTITQQYVKNAFVGRERTLWRKVKEAVVAVKLERGRTKDQILEAYLNVIYFGRGAYGIDAASSAYFGVTPRELTLPQAALLAGLIQAPETLNPDRAPKAALSRRNWVIDAMVQQGFVSSTDASTAKATPVRVLARSAARQAPYFMEDVRRELVARFGSAAVYRGGLRVTTTLDLRMQQAAERAVRETLDRADDPDAALVAIDPATGAVRALVGGRDFGSRPFDIATQGRRQPGSAFKPFVLAAALSQGVSLETTFPAPALLSVPLPGGAWNVSNYDRKNYGTLSLLRATELSVNTVYARLVLQVGPQAAASAARAAGTSGPLAEVPSIALGTSPVTPLELTGAYATFASGGMRSPPTLLERVVNAGKTVVFEAGTARTRAMSEQVAGGVTTALRGVLEAGTGRSAAIGRPAAGKTGTTEDHSDAWFVGYTPDLVASVWMGYADGKRTMQNVRGIAVTGGSFPARIWRSFMTRALAGTPARSFPAWQPSPTPTTQSPSPTPSGVS